MYINDNANVSMSGKEYNALQQEMDKLREMYENKAKEAKDLKVSKGNLIKRNNKLLTDNVVQSQTIDNLTKKVKKLELYETAYKAESKEAKEVLDRAKVVINIEGVSLWV